MNIKKCLKQKKKKKKKKKEKKNQFTGQKIVTKMGP